MNQDNDNEFWSKVGDSVKPRLSEAQWTAQRARILSRLAPSGSGRLLPWAAAAAVACLAGLWFMLPNDSEDKVVERIPAPVAASDTWDARVTRVQGQVTVFSKGSEEGVPAAVGMPLEEGDFVRTGADGHAELSLSADSVIDLGPVSAITLSNLKPKETLLNLDLGTMVSKLRWDQSLGRRLEVQTPTVVIAVRGTEFGVTVEETGASSVGVFDEGKVAVQTKDAPAIEETLLMPHQEVHVPMSEPAQTETKEGRTYLVVRELSDLKPYQETIERVRERPDALSREWKEMDRPERELVRGRMIQEHQGRMQSLPPEERQSLREQLRRPGPNDGAMRQPGGQGGGQAPGQQVGPRGGQAPGQQAGPHGGQTPGQQAGSMQDGPGRQESRRGQESGGPQPGSRHENQGQREGRERDQGGALGRPDSGGSRRSQDGERRGRQSDGGAPGSEQGDGSRRHVPDGPDQGGGGQPEEGQQQPGDRRQQPVEGQQQPWNRQQQPGDGQHQPGDRRPQLRQGGDQRPPGGGFQPRGQGGEPRHQGPGSGGGMRPPGGHDRIQGGQNSPQGGQNRQHGGRPQGGQNGHPGGRGGGRQP